MTGLIIGYDSLGCSQVQTSKQEDYIFTSMIALILETSFAASSIEL